MLFLPYILTLLTPTLGTPILPHLNTTWNPPTPSLSSNLTTTTTNWECYYPLPPLSSPTLRHCTRVITGIQRLNLPSRPLLFSRAESADLVLPVKFTYRTCSVVIDVGEDLDAEDYVTRKYLIAQIEKLEDACVVQAPFLGGEGPLGRRGVLRVGIMGPLAPEGMGVE